jgi:hypothetical protein
MRLPNQQFSVTAPLVSVQCLQPLSASMLACSRALVAPVLQAAQQLTRFGWSRVSVGPDEVQQDKEGDDDDHAAEEEEGGRVVSSGQRLASSSSLIVAPVSCFARCRLCLGCLGLVQGGVSRRLCRCCCWACSRCGCARSSALHHCGRRPRGQQGGRQRSSQLGHFLSRCA